MYVHTRTPKFQEVKPTSSSLTSPYVCNSSGSASLTLRIPTHSPSAVAQKFLISCRYPLSCPDSGPPNDYMLLIFCRIHRPTDFSNFTGPSEIQKYVRNLVKCQTSSSLTTFFSFSLAHLETCCTQNIQLCQSPLYGKSEPDGSIRHSRSLNMLRQAVTSVPFNLLLSYCSVCIAYTKSSPALNLTQNV